MTSPSEKTPPALESKPTGPPESRPEEWPDGTALIVGGVEICRKGENISKEEIKRRFAIANKRVEEEVIDKLVIVHPNEK